MKALEVAVTLNPNLPVWRLEFYKSDLMVGGYSEQSRLYALGDWMREILQSATSYLYEVSSWEDHSRRMVVVEACMNPPINSENVNGLNSPWMDEM